MIEITSLNNSRVRRVQALQRSTRRRMRAGLMVAEGLRLVREVVEASLQIVEIFYTSDFVADPRGAALLDRLKRQSTTLLHVPDEVMAAMSDTETPQGILAVFPIPALRDDATSGVTLLPDRIRDPGNMGTMLRTAWAAGVRRVLIPPGCVDPTNPKVVRAGMGAHFHVPLHKMAWTQIEELIAGDSVWLAEAEGGVPYDRVDWSGAVTLIIGGEARGAGPEALALAGGHYVYIPMAPGVESLNAAMAATVLLFEARRQRLASAI